MGVCSTGTFLSAQQHAWIWGLSYRRQGLTVHRLTKWLWVVLHLRSMRNHGVAIWGDQIYACYQNDKVPGCCVSSTPLFAEHGGLTAFLKLRLNLALAGLTSSLDLLLSSNLSKGGLLTTNATLFSRLQNYVNRSWNFLRTFTFLFKWTCSASREPC